MQIESIILYGKYGKKRILSLNKGKVNLITGKSKTGKSILGNLIEYCLGGKSCNIADGVVRDRTVAYALLLNHNNEYLFVARDNPPHGQDSTNRCYYRIGSNEIPDNLSSITSVDNETLEQLLSEKIGIKENLSIVPEDKSRNKLTANIRHALFYCIQNQDEIASQKTLFHRQAEPFIDLAIKDTMPYFLGLIDDENLALEAERTRLKRDLNILNKQIKEVEQVTGNGYFKALSLIEEAKQVGLTAQDLDIAGLDYEGIKNILIKISEWDAPIVQIEGMDKLAQLQNKLEETQKKYDNISLNIRNTEKFLGEVRGYNGEVTYQKSRLESIGLFDQLDFDSSHCPFCSHELENPLPVLDEMRKAIKDLSARLDTVSKERPRLRQHIDNLQEDKQRTFEEVRGLQNAINSFYETNRTAFRLRDANARKGRVIGRISLWLESVKNLDSSDHQKKLNQKEEIEKRLNWLDARLDGSNIEERKLSISNRLAAMMSQWAKEMQLEYSDYPYRLDMNKLTVVVDRERAIPLQQLGSGANWLGCHLIALFALHTFFRKNNLPVPAFLFIDQPSQVYFPPESTHGSVDSQGIRDIYNFIFERVSDLNGEMQVIVVDHADLDEERFQNAVIEKWWDNEFLVPEDWEII